MKTYLLIYDNQCQRCSHRWTTSYVTNSWAMIISPFIKVEVISAYFPAKQDHQACFNCMPPSTLKLPWPHGTHEPPQSGNPAPKSPNLKPAIKAANITLDDILED